MHRSTRHGAASTLRTAVLAAILLAWARPLPAEPIRWPQPDGLGTAVLLTYSFANLLEVDFLRTISERELRAATAEAFRLWASYAPLHFVERVDSGPPPSDNPYFAADHPQIRIGAHPIEAPSAAEPWVLAHAFLPVDVATNGLAGDIHFNTATPFLWGLGTFGYIDFLEVMAHEIGHALGLRHIHGDAIMSPFHGHYFRGLGSGFLFPSDIEAVQILYGAGSGSVRPIPEPATVVLVASAFATAQLLRRRRSGHWPGARAPSGSQLN